MWRWKARAALEDNQQTTGTFSLDLNSLKRARRHGGPNEFIFAHAKISLSHSLIYAMKEVWRFSNTCGFNTGVFLRAAPLGHQKGGKSDSTTKIMKEGEMKRDTVETPIPLT